MTFKFYNGIMRLASIRMRYTAEKEKKQLIEIDRISIFFCFPRFLKFFLFFFRTKNIHKNKMKLAFRIGEPEHDDCRRTGNAIA